MSFARAQRIPLTLFAIGRDLEDDQAADAVRRAAEDGARVENHSWAHRYDLSRLSAGRIDEEIERASAVIARVTGRNPRGFRAPGYVTSKALMAGVRRSGLVFDASPLPCPAYYVAKLAAMAAIRIRGRHTRAVVGSAAAQLGPRQPHRVGDLVSIPMAVTRRLRLPVIGTTLALFGARLIRGCLGDPVISLELHGIDLLDASDDLADLAPHQWDLRVPRDEKLAAFAEAIALLRSAGYAFVPLEDVEPAR
jgi:peptidoglycan/xylan/chitin deacetylase (PgdA/CDA1 family)